MRDQRERDGHDELAKLDSYVGWGYVAVKLVETMLESTLIIGIWIVILWY